jgi:hypothetical protein
MSPNYRCYPLLNTTKILVIFKSPIIVSVYEESEDDEIRYFLLREST